MTGKVYLVGAGPSDPGLFTIKGLSVLQKADVVVYDALVGESILQLIPDTAEAINAGKRSSHHLMKQKDTNELLAEKAKEGKTVVRLKGGDPFLFGRGGEEIEVLLRENVPYEVVPGIPSAIAVPAYQGIPVTHRDFCSSVHIITGHRREGEEYDIDFEALVRTRGTLVFLMGVAALGDICRHLIAAGMDPKKPAALLSQGTKAEQDKVIATVSTLQEAVKQHGAKTPAIIVVGDVCGLSESFSWYEKTPLGGIKVLVTRPRQLISKTAEKLRAYGADVLEFPAIRTDKIEDNAALYEALDHLNDYAWLVFTSPTGVRIFFEQVQKKLMDVRRFSGIKIAAIGDGTRKELSSRGFYPDLMPEIFDGDHLGAALAEVVSEGEKVLIPRAEVGNQELVKAITAAGASADDIPTYRTVYETSRIVNEKELLEKGVIDYVLFTSASSAKGFAAAVGEFDYSKIKAVCIGKQTAEAAKSFGMETFVSEKASIDSLIEKLLQVHKGGKDQ